MVKVAAPGLTGLNSGCLRSSLKLAGSSGLTTVALFLRFVPSSPRTQASERYLPAPWLGAGLKALIPKRFDGPAGGNPSELDQPAEGMIAVWELAQRNAAKQQRKNGPTKEDVADAREELRPALLEQGLIREAPKAFQQSNADRIAAAERRRQQTIEVRTVEQEEQAKRSFEETLKEVAKSAPERARQAKVNAVKEELARPERERQARLEDKVRQYNRKLIAAYESVHDLLIFLRGVDRVDGTQYLDEMRQTDVMGLVTVRDDLPRIKGLGEELMEIAQLANSCNPPTGIDMTTLEVEVD